MITTKTALLALAAALALSACGGTTEETKPTSAPVTATNTPSQTQDPRIAKGMQTIQKLNDAEAMEPENTTLNMAPIEALTRNDYATYTRESLQEFYAEKKRIRGLKATFDFVEYEYQGAGKYTLKVCEKISARTKIYLATKKEEKLPALKGMVEYQLAEYADKKTYVVGRTEMRQADGVTDTPCPNTK